jgi:hypothetical protein
MLKEEIKIIKILTELNFDFIDKNEFSMILENFYKNFLHLHMERYSLMGWREKIIFSFFVLLYPNEQFLKKIEQDIFLNPNGKELKTYLLVIMLMSEKEIKNYTIKKLLDNYDLFTPQKKWISASSQLIDFKFLGEINTEKHLNKYLKAINIVNIIRKNNNLELVQLGNFPN